MAKDRDETGDELKAMLGFAGLARPATNRPRIDREQLGDVGLSNSRQAPLHLLQKTTAIGACPSDELIESVSNHVTHSLDPDESRLESIEIARLRVHRRVDVDESRIQSCPLLVAEVGGLELWLQVGEPPAHVGKALVRGAVYLGVAGHFVEGLLECSLDALDLGIDLEQSAALRVLGGGDGQAVSFLSAR